MPSFAVGLHNAPRGRAGSGMTVTADLRKLQDMIREWAGEGQITYVAAAGVPYALYLEYGYHTRRGNYVPGRPAGTMAGLRMQNRYRGYYLSAARGLLSGRVLRRLPLEVAEATAEEWRKNIRAMHIIDTGAYLGSIEVLTGEEFERMKGLPEGGTKDRRTRTQRANVLKRLYAGGSSRYTNRWRSRQIRAALKARSKAGRHYR